MADEGSSPEMIGTAPHGVPSGETEKINIESLRLRDRVTLQTARDIYLLTIGKNSRCILSSTNPSAKVGRIILRGGTNGDATEYTPNRIFVGGRLAYAFDEEASSLVTTPVITSLVCEPGLR
jgi:hypothetical protein